RVGRPAAVARLVVAVVVDALNRHAFGAFWTRTHVVRKIFKTGIPSLTNLDAAAAVVSVAPVLRVAASGPHLSPNVVDRRSISSMLPRTVANQFRHVASAGLRCAAPQTGRLRYGRVSAIAYAAPSRLAGAAARSAASTSYALDNQKPAKFLAGNIETKRAATHARTLSMYARAASSLMISQTITQFQSAVIGRSPPPHAQAARATPCRPRKLRSARRPSRCSCSP